jgi:Uma2 family endonuclease
MVATKHYTVAEYQQMDSASDRFELIKGELREVAAAKSRHGAIGGRLIILLGSAQSQQPAGEFFLSETGFIVSRDPDSLLMPDIGFVKSERLTNVKVWDDFVPFAPDLAVEIESPSNREGEILEKVALYLRGGTHLVWLIRPRHRTVTVFRPGVPEQVLSEADVLDAGNVVPGFKLQLSDLFKGIPD